MTQKPMFCWSNQRSKLNLEIHERYVNINKCRGSIICQFFAWFFILEHGLLQTNQKSIIYFSTAFMNRTGKSNLPKTRQEIQLQILISKVLSAA